MASGGPTGSATARPRGGRLSPHGRFTPLRQSPVGRCFDHGARRDCREALAGGGSQHLYRRRMVACWHIATCHHAARGRSTLRDPGLMGLRTGPALPFAPRTAPRWGGTGGWRRRTLAGGAGPRPSHRAAAAALAWGSFSPAPAAGGGGGGGGGGPRRGGMGRLAGGWGVDRRLDGRWPDRQAGRRGLDKGSDGRLPIPPVLREGHPEPAIDDWGGPERVVGRVRTAGRSEKWSRRERRERESEGGRVARWQSHPGGGTAG